MFAETLFLGNCSCDPFAYLERPKLIFIHVNTELWAATASIKRLICFPCLLCDLWQQTRIHYASILRPRRSLYVHPASLELPLAEHFASPLRTRCVSSASIGVSSTTVLLFKSVRRPRRPWWCLNVLESTFERPRRPFCVLCGSNGACFMVAQETFKRPRFSVKGS